MAAAEPIYPPQGILSPRQLAEQAFSRAAGAPLVPGNQVRLLRDAEANYPAWLAAIQNARRTIHFESYIIKDDHSGNRFAEAFIDKARQGVRVSVIYDWFGARGMSSRRFWQRLRAGGVKVRCFNPPKLDNPLGWLSRDHRKVLVVDGELGFVGGLCVGDDWVGNPDRGIDPWRDTAVEVRGPATADLEWCFANMWKVAGGRPGPMEDFLADGAEPGPAGDTELRVVATAPNTAGNYRLEHLMAALARRSIWITDAYFVATTAFLQALEAAARDGVDVRILLPRVSDVPLVRSISRAGYRPLLESGVRIFEWNGAMLHAKTAVVDKRWARVGSSNLNLASWIGNWELDILVEDDAFAEQMEAMYLDDLSHSTEIVLAKARRVRPVEMSEIRRRGRRRLAQGSAGRAASGVVAITNTIGAVITRRRTLGPAEAQVMFTAGALLVAISVLGWLWPALLAVPLGIAGAWVGFTLLLGAWRLWRKSGEMRESSAAEETEPTEQAVAMEPSVAADSNTDSEARERSQLESGKMREG